MRWSVIVTVLAVAAATWFVAGRYDNDRKYTTSSEEAYELYLQGEQALNSFQWQKAEILLQNALDLDPGFAMAQAALAELYRSTSTPETHAAAVARAESLAALLPDPDERMVVELRANRWSEAGKTSPDSLLKVLAKHLPDHPVVLVTEAVKAMYSGNPDEAARLWARVLEIDPNYARAYNWLGYLEAGRGNYEEAIRNLRKYAFLSPDLANPHDSLGEILTFVGRYEEAEAEFLTALDMQKDFFPSLLNLARVYLAQGKLKDGVELLEKTRGQIAGTPWEQRVDLILVNTYFSHKLDSLCTQACTHYIASYPEDPVSSYFRALHLARDQQFDQARAVADSFFAALREKYAGEDEEEAHSKLERWEHTFNAVYAELLGQHHLAADEWEALLAEADGVPPHERSFWETAYAEVLTELGRHADAVSVARTSLATNPRLIRPLLSLTESLTALGRYDEARETLDRLKAILAEADPGLPAAKRAGELRSILDEQPRS